MRKEGEYLPEDYREEFLDIYIKNFILRIREVVAFEDFDDLEIDKESFDETFPILARMFEKEQYKKGTEKICEYLSKLNSTVIIGGGDTAAAAISFGYKDSFTHISTGGGASLEMMEGKVLPGVDIINER